MIRDATEADADGIAEIYNYYIENTVVTFEEQHVSSDDIATRIEKVQAGNLPWLVAVTHGQIVGYAYATPWKARSAYRFAAESTVYLSNSALGQGLGTKLYLELFQRLKNQGIQTVIGGITLPNPLSVALHKIMGMKKVAHFEKVGFKFDKWQDVGYWQKSL